MAGTLDKTRTKSSRKNANFTEKHQEQKEQHIPQPKYIQLPAHNRKKRAAQTLDTHASASRVGPAAQHAAGCAGRPGVACWGGVSHVQRLLPSSNLAASELGEGNESKKPWNSLCCAPARGNATGPMTLLPLRPDLRFASACLVATVMWKPRAGRAADTKWVSCCGCGCACVRRRRCQKIALRRSEM